VIEGPFVRYDSTLSSLISYSDKAGALFISEILFREFRKCCCPFDKMNSGVSDIQFYANNIKAEGTKMVAAKTIFQSSITHDHKAMKKIPNEKLA
jgi:hypothetical protein